MRMMTFVTALPILLLTIAGSARDTASDDKAAEAAGQIASTSSRIGPTSIYQVWPLTDAAVIGGASLTVALPYAFSATLITPRCPCDPSEVNALDRGAIGLHSDFADRLSTATVAVAIAGPVLYEAFDLGLSTPFAEDMVVLAEAVAVNGALVTIAKYAVQRPIPRVYEGQAPGTAANYRSFYSGHASTVFAVLSVEAQTISTRHGGAPWLWAVAVVVGGSVAVERVLAGYHFPTDVVVGALIGTATGLTVSWLHERPQPLHSSLALVPRPDGLTISWSWRF
jgi:membrane-associated phospholipid phosphatase